MREPAGPTAELRDFEEQLDRLIDEASTYPARRRAPDINIEDELADPPADDPSDAPGHATPPEPYASLERLHDFDPAYDQSVRATLEFLYTRYLRVDTRGVEHVPARGPCLLVANASATAPLDALMLKTAVKLEHSAARDLRWLTDDSMVETAFLGTRIKRLGAVRASGDAMARLLAHAELCGLFQDGPLDRALIDACRQTQTPIVPVAVTGAKVPFRIEALVKTLGRLAFLPAPTKWRIEFGEPIDVRDGGHDAADRVRVAIESMQARARRARKGIFFG